MKIHDILKQKAVLKLILNQIRDVLSTGSSFDLSLLLVAATSLNAHQHQRDPTPLESASSFFLSEPPIGSEICSGVGGIDRGLQWAGEEWVLIGAPAPPGELWISPRLEVETLSL